MTTLLIITHVLVSFFLIAIVLLQHGKGADIGATFGGSGQSVFGSEGPVPLLNKITTFSAIVFMGTSISLAYISANEHSNSVMKDLPAQETAAPAEKEVPVTIPMPGTESQVEEPAAPVTDASPAVQEALSEAATASSAVQESEAAEVELAAPISVEKTEEPVAEASPAVQEALAEETPEVTPVAEDQNIEAAPATQKQQTAPVEQEAEPAPEKAE